ncbi:MA3 DOMAIN-CONTAINING TRANSLATION REGULATORY FACTOR 2 [Beta vulgaris subsp. vulgaris]|uniref:MA3 DOMAIN-CONTAINING TRANSLATION REGULATORY FACTOR 2 n=1 Tax=Beta vulgaris subsp. vulgaris TaxID=3555 RepID=UPI00203726A5|nr:MA3 DOMAIN-CONTAINING TRANSLATION REGULATORY FACTOR 2 [Beta vulgaris subsp. vulgaris]
MRDMPDDTPLEVKLGATEFNYHEELSTWVSKDDVKEFLCGDMLNVSCLKKVGRTGRVPQWKAMKCAQQPGRTECGYYVLRFMFDIASCCKEVGDIDKENEVLTPRTRSIAMEEYRKKAIVIIEEYFTNDDVISTANELRELGMPNYDYYFVKKLVSIAMDRHDKEKEMAAVLLSSLYADVISSAQVYKGFSKLVECADDLVVDIPNAVDILAIFIARAIVDDILPPIFLKKQKTILPKESKGVEVIKRTEKGYLYVPYHAEIIENKWGGSKNNSVEGVKTKINNLLTEFVVSGDKKEACMCIKDLNVPYFHHEIMKRALIIAMERRKVEDRILQLLKMAAEEGLINSSQITKGFNRMIDTIDDLSLDIPDARQILQSIISKCASEGWLSASSLKSFSVEPKIKSLEEGVARSFKMKAQAIIHEYFSSRDTIEVYNCLESENCTSSSQLNAIFVKRLVNLAMDRKNKEKEMASVLLSSLCLPADDVANGFIMLIESADDIALDNPVIVEDLVKFLARAIVDEVIAPSHLEDIGNQFTRCDSKGHKIIQMTNSLLKARLSGERILRCWGGEGSRGNGWTVDDVKDKIGKLLEEYECGGDIREACRCIKELGVPFFHHEVVKKALVIVVEKRNERLWKLLQECFTSGLITMNQMAKGFARVEECLDDLALDVPDAKQQFTSSVQKAKSSGWLDALSFPNKPKDHVVKNNDFCS